MSDPYVGEIRMFGFARAPVGWAVCDGSQVLVQQNMALYAALGAAFDVGVPSTDNGPRFFLPDFRGRMPIGVNANASLTALPAVDFADQGGAATASVRTNDLPPHTHSLPASGAVSVSIAIPARKESSNLTQTPGPGTVLAAGVSSGHAVAQYSLDAADTTLEAFTAPADFGGQRTGSSGSSESGQTIQLMNPYLVVNFCICQQGVFPTFN